MKLAIITAILNERAKIEGHIDYLISVCSEYNAIYIIADGGSVDGSQQLVIRDASSECIFLENTGTIYNSWNKSLAELDSDVTHVVFLGVGDRLHDEFLNNIFSSAGIFNDDIITSGVQIGIKKFGIQNEKEILHSILFSRFACMPIHHSGTIFSLRLFRLAGDFNVSYLICADLDWMLKLRNIDPLKLRVYSSYGVYLLPGGVSAGGNYAFRVMREEIIISFKQGKLPCFKRMVYLLYSYAIYKFKFLRSA